MKLIHIVCTCIHFGYTHMHMSNAYMYSSYPQLCTMFMFVHLLLVILMVTSEWPIIVIVWFRAVATEYSPASLIA